MENITLPNNTYFLSDNHFGHKNIIKYDNREFTDVHEMDSYMIKQWNSTVSNNDIVVYGGDFAIGKGKYISDILDQLNGKIIYIIGNHDKELIKLKHHKIISYHDILCINIASYSVIVSHYPQYEWAGKYRGSLHLHGHTHNNIKDEVFYSQNVMDISSNGHDYKPLSINEILGKLVR